MIWLQYPKLVVDKALHKALGRTLGRTLGMALGMALLVSSLMTACTKSEPTHEQAAKREFRKPETRASEPRASEHLAQAFQKKLSELPSITRTWRSHLPMITAEHVPNTVKQADAALARGQLERGSSPGPGALELYLAILAVDPANEAAQRGVQLTLTALFEQGRAAMLLGNFPKAERIESMARSVQPGHSELVAYRAAIESSHAAQQLVHRAQMHIKANKFSHSRRDEVVQLLQSALAKFPGYIPAIEGLFHWHAVLLEKAWKAALADDFHQADAYLLEAQRLNIDRDAYVVMDLRIIELRQARTDELLSKGHALVDKLQLDRADKILNQLSRIAAQRYSVDTLRQRIHLARHYGLFKPGQIFSEPLDTGVRGPVMVVIPYGRFSMGSPEDEPNRLSNEGPKHEVIFVRGFAIGQSEVTVADFARFIVATGYKTLATRRGRSTVYDEKGGMMSEHAGVDWQRDYRGRPAASNLPVVHVAFNDAQAYTRWLSEQTGQRYRLPTEAEFEYVLRAGTDTIYPWGTHSPKGRVGNLSGEHDAFSTKRRWGRGQVVAAYQDGFLGPAPIGRFDREGFGTVDMIGNVSEWTQDCWHDSYRRAPDNGSAWVNSGCEQHVVRGASWASSLPQARSAYRVPALAKTTIARLGFRVVREL